MSPTKLFLPDLGEKISRGVHRIVEILVKPGDSVQQDQSVLTVETDVATIEIPSDRTGVVDQMFVSLGQEVKHGALLLSYREEEGTASPKVTQSIGTESRTRQKDLPSRSPIRSLLEVASIKRSGPPIDYDAPEAIAVNISLGLYQRAGLSAAVLRVVDLDTQHPIRFDPDAGRSGMLQVWESMQEGRIFLFFDQFELVALVEKTLTKKFLVISRPSYKVYLATPFTPILISESEDSLSRALGWLERRVQKCIGVFSQRGEGMAH